jgi:polyisoprenoid-binding protein YceI
MKLKTFSIAAAALLLAGSLSAQTWTRYEAQPGSKMKIAGTSTVHDWTVESGIIAGSVEVDAAFPAEPDAKATPGKVNARVQTTLTVRSLKSGTKAMDDVMHEAMNMVAFPKIEYRLTEMTLKAPATGPTLQFETKGELTLSGVTNKITMPVTMDRSEKGKLKFSGETTVKMTSFGIKPPAPSLGLGLIKTGDDVKLTFEWKTALPAKAP